MSNRGTQRERAVRYLLHDNGWWTARAAGSLGDADIIAIADRRILLIEVKSVAAGPFQGFSPANRKELIEAAVRTGGEAWLVWWPVRRDPLWLPADLWPTPENPRGSAREGLLTTPHSGHPPIVKSIVDDYRIRTGAQPRQLAGQMRLPL